jgi:hypothetical protein
MRTRNQVRWDSCTKISRLWWCSQNSFEMDVLSLEEKENGIWGVQVGVDKISISLCFRLDRDQNWHIIWWENIVQDIVFVIKGKSCVWRIEKLYCILLMHFNK